MTHKLNGRSIIEAGGEAATEAGRTSLDSVSSRNVAEVRRELSATGAKIGLVVETIDGDDVVKAASIVAAINDAESSVIISADHISLNGKSINLTSDNIAINSTNFSVTTGGAITAKSGSIGGWLINSTYLGSSQTGGSFYITGPEDNSPYWMRAHDAAGGGGNRTFSVGKDGSFTATKGSISGDVQINGSCIVNGTLNASSIEIDSSGFAKLPNGIRLSEAARSAIHHSDYAAATVIEDGNSVMLQTDDHWIMIADGYDYAMFDGAEIITAASKELKGQWRLNYDTPDPTMYLSRVVTVDLLRRAGLINDSMRDLLEGWT